MEREYLHAALPFLKKIDRGRQRQFETYFSSAPLWLINMFQCEELEAGRTFIRENEPADTIFFVGKGKVKATDYRISGIAYDFMKPSNLIALGGMEVIMELDHYQTTLQTVTRCTIAKLPRSQYEKWLYSDMRAFRQEVRITCTSLLEEERRNRLYLFFQGADRLALLLVEWYERYGRCGTLCIRESRQDLADETGLCLKSVSRAVKKLVDDGLITKNGNQIVINPDQYDGLREMVDEKTNRV